MERRERGRAMVDWLVYNRYADNRGDLAMRIGYNPTVLSAALTGRIPFSDKLAKVLCQYNKRLNYNWLMFEEGEMLNPEDALVIERAQGGAQHGNEERTPEKHDLSISKGNAQRKCKMVPFYRELQCSAGQTDMFGYDEAHEEICFPGVDAEAFFPVTGMSMQPTIMPGDIIGVKSVDSLERIDPTRIYLIITRQNERMIKHIQPSKPEDDTITLTSDNSDYTAFTIMKEDVLKVMRVVFTGRIL